MDEAISRQKVIDKLDEAFERITKNVSKESDAYHIVYGTVDITKCMIMTLPPIQPEIVRCKDCKHFEYDHPYIIQGIPVLGHEVCNAWGDGCKTDENGYCFMAERRTDEA